MPIFDVHALELQWLAAYRFDFHVYLFAGTTSTILPRMFFRVIVAGCQIRLSALFGRLSPKTKYSLSGTTIGPKFVSVQCCISNVSCSNLPSTKTSPFLISILSLGNPITLL